MNILQRSRGWLRILAIGLSVAMPLTFTVSSADARVGGSSSFGSRGARTWSTPPSTPTAPNSASPFQRSITPPAVNNPVNTAANRGGFFNRPGLLGGLAAGFLGAGLFGMLFGGSLFGGLGGLSSIFGLLIQIALIFFVARLVMSWWARRNVPAYANGAPPSADQAYARTDTSFGIGANAAPLEITQADYQSFERCLGEIQAAWSSEDIAALHKLATPEMVSYFTQDLQANAARGVVNKVSGVKLLQGDLAEAWREGPADYATVALRFALIDKTLDRVSGQIVEGSDAPQEATEVWTFQRRPGTDWELSAIQQA
ncbi:MAG: TIM44-like domain-containing protein [Xanthobacteraceae bacterium]|nr:TIM44-like domain-containing protein [Xanthobacteraceae bacterium]